MPSGRRAITSWCLALLALLVGCAAPAPEPTRPPATRDAAPPAAASAPPPSGATPLLGPDDARALAAHPELRAEIAKSPHRFFRFVNKSFAQRVCDRLDRVEGPGPTVNLHGDAHLEQYAVSSEERGLADFDASSTGPAGLDLVRFAASLRLAAAQNGFPHASRQLIGALLEGYERALDDPRTSVPEPRVAARIRARFETHVEAWLDKTTTLMREPPPVRKQRLELALADYAGRLVRQDPRLSPAYFRIARAGAIDMGIGSALEQKYLARIEGPSPTPGDDLILELKQVSDLRGISCLAGSAGHDPFRVIAGHLQVGAAPTDLLGYLRLDGELFYVHKWRFNYTELRLADLTSAEEVAEVAYEVGVQLGRGHARHIPAPYDVQLRGALRAHLDSRRLHIHEWSDELAREVVAEWEALRAPP